MRPRLLFLTDGGGEDRMKESRRALRSIGLPDSARFLGWTERSLYDALLARDMRVIRRLVAQVRRELIAMAPQQVICESVELYNPLHDITLPIVLAAAEGLPRIEIVEFPLIAQEPSPVERYRVQRFPAGRQATSIQLEATELATKLRARDHYYQVLRRTMAGVLDSVPDKQAGAEVFGYPPKTLPTPGRDHVLRYEWRARVLQERGEIDRIITFADHFEPVAAALRAG